MKSHHFGLFHKCMLLPDSKNLKKKERKQLYTPIFGLLLQQTQERNSQS